MRGQGSGSKKTGRTDWPASDSPACARASSRLSRGIGLDAAALSDTKSHSPPLSSILCAMHAAELRKKRSASVSWSMAALLPMECDTNCSTLSVSSPDDTVRTRAHASAASAASGSGASAAPALAPALAPASPPAALRFLRLATLSTSASVAALAAATTSRARSRSSRSPRDASIAASSTKMSTVLRLMSALVSSVSSSSSSRSPSVCRRYRLMPQHRSVIAVFWLTSSPLAIASRSRHSVRPTERWAISDRRSVVVLARSRSTSCATVRFLLLAPCSDELSDMVPR